jgi:hypothetical protein
MMPCLLRLKPKYHQKQNLEVRDSPEGRRVLSRLSFRAGFRSVDQLCRLGGMFGSGVHVRDGSQEHAMSSPQNSDRRMEESKSARTHHHELVMWVRTHC